jgi:cysteinyl-tRNA synthetase
MNQIQLYNTLTKKKEEFIPHEPPHVKMYCCGPTVYDLLHVGNFRGAIVYNLLRNWLEESGYKVTHVYNYTDVDDKIIDRAKRENVTATEISEKYIAEFKKDFGRLGLRKHTHNPKVSEFMTPIKDMVADLITQKKAYVVNGEVLYSIRSFDGYGKLSHRNIDEMKIGVRIEANEKKQDPLDFALWKPAKSGEPSWESPWGAGRPGWHIECSAMAKSILGEQIDIHGGGIDLVFPHHENEIAQSEGCTGKQFVKYWVHNNLLNFDGAKMSKSVGNIRTARSFMDEFHPEIFKFLILSSHYRSVSEFGENTIDLAIKGLARIYSAMAVAESYLEDSEVKETTLSPQYVSGFEVSPEIIPQDVRARLETYKSKGLDVKLEALIQQCEQKISAALNDDLGTPEVFAQFFEVVRAFNSQTRRGAKATPEIANRCRSLRLFLLKWGSLMSLFQLPAKEFLVALDDLLLQKMNLQRSTIDQLVQERTQARENKDFAKSDELRKKLTEMGISVSDLQNGSFWEVSK